MVSNPFDYISAINAGKDIITTADDVLLAEDGYDPFITNKCLSYHVDAVFYANEMNINYELDKLMQYHYFMGSLRPRKRFAKWHRPDSRADIQLVKDAYDVSHEKATTILSLLTKEQLEAIRTELSLGGS